MAINSNTKGKVAEREVAELLKKYRFEARRGVQYSGGSDSPDVVSNLGLHIEVKRVEAFNLYSAVDQAIKDSNSIDYVIFHRKNKRDWQAILDARTFLSIVENRKDLCEANDKLREEINRLKNIEEKYNALTR